MTSRAVILSADAAAEYFTEEQCHILELSNSDADEGASVARARVEPGVTTRRHRVAGTIERYVIQSGTGIVSIEGLADTGRTGCTEAINVRATDERRVRAKGNGLEDILTGANPAINVDFEPVANRRNNIGQDFQ